MTIKLKILKNGVQTHGATSDQFESIEAFEAWKQQCIDSNVWGLPERPELNEMGEPTGVMLEAEYSLEISDISQQIEQERINQEAQAYLTSTDWMAVRQAETGVQMSEEVRIARAAARMRIVN